MDELEDIKENEILKYHAYYKYKHEKTNTFSNEFKLDC